MKRSWLCVALLLSALSVEAASFSYRGQLQDGGRPADGRYDLELTLYSAPEGGSVVAGPLLLYAVPVHDGSFDTQADFGALANLPDAAWLGVKLRVAGANEYTALGARAPVSAALTAATSSVCPGAWTLGGNAGNPAGSYLGTADAQPLTFKVNGAQVGRIYPGSAPNPQFVNVVFGPNSVPVTTGSVVSGGNANVAGYFAAIGGGSNNQAGLPSIGPGADTIGGGSYNIATGGYSTVGGGYANTASGYGSSVPGGQNNQGGGSNSFAAGYGATVRAGDNSTFVWSDSSGFTSTGPNQFIVRSTGGVGINTAPADANTELTLESNGGPYANFLMRDASTKNGMMLTTDGGTAGNDDATFYLDDFDGSLYKRRLWLRGDLGFVGFNINAAPAYPLVVGTNNSTGNGAHVTTGGAWTNGSSREFKEAFAAIDVGSVLDSVLNLSIQSWKYKGPEEGRHLGPVAEDFKAAFGLGDDARYIATVDEEGVALAAIQGLNRKLETENASLREQLDAEHAAVQHLAERLEKLEQAGGK